MQNTKHTPGPWLIEPASRKYNVHCVHTKDGQILCYTPKGDFVSKQNARLIAAAPEMYELLRLISAHMKMPPCAKWNAAFLGEISKVLDKVEGQERPLENSL